MFSSTTLRLFVTASTSILAWTPAVHGQTLLSAATGGTAAGAGDVDGDGFDDVIVGDPTNNAARVYSGQTGTLLYSLNGGATFVNYGRAVDGGKDVNADGFADFVVSAPDEVTALAPHKGVVRVFSGKDGTQILFLHGFVPGDSLGDRFGTSVALVGDVNADGHADVLVGSPEYGIPGQYTGAARAFSGLNGAVLFTWHGVASLDNFGWSVASGDVNGDGKGDFVIGVPGHDEPFPPCCTIPEAGQVNVYSGSNGGLLYSFNGNQTGNSLGLAVGTALVNADTRADVIGGEPGNDQVALNAGRTRVFSGATGAVLFTFFGAFSGESSGEAVGGAGDLDGDGREEVIVGAPEGNGPNRARVYSGASGALLYTLNGTSNGDGFGHAVDGAGDVNGDGFGDFVVGTGYSGYSKIYSGINCGPCFPVGIAFCFGHGGDTPCPCANHSPAGSGAGCLHSSGSGARITGSGIASVSNDTVVLDMTGALPTVPCVFFQGANQAGGGNGVVLGDGLLCAGSPIVRLGSKTASGGAASFPQAGDPSISVAGNVVAGTTYHYQVQYRDSAVFCTSDTFNQTNGYSITWGP
jgi:hypothetical protein